MTLLGEGDSGGRRNFEEEKFRGQEWTSKLLLPNFPSEANSLLSPSFALVSGINHSSEIVGAKPAATAGSRAYLYFGGLSIDLNELVDPSLPLLTGASHVSNNGKIVVNAVNGQLYVLTPK